MTGRGIVPAEVDFGDPEAPRAPLFGDVYHARHGAFAQARHVFLAGNGLPGRWRDRAAFTVLETGFGLGNNFLATWDAWRADPRRPNRLRFVSIEKHPLREDDLRRALAASEAPALAARLCAAWPPLTPDLHLLPFDEPGTGDRVELILALGDAVERLRDLVATVDAFYLDGFTPARNPQMWDAGVFKALSRLAAPGATAATWSAARAVRDGLSQAGFAWQPAAGSGGKRDITLATFAPRVRPRPPAARVGRDDHARVAIVGGGLAGAASARALAREGLACVVLDASPDPAGGASGNAAGLFHGVFHPDDGLHARAHRAAALQAASAYEAVIAEGVAGRRDGLLRLVPEHADAAPLAAQLAASGLPASWLQAWEPGRVQAAGGPACAAWFYPGGGWISPAELVRAWLATTGVQWRGGMAVERLEQVAPAGERPQWRLLDAEGGLLAEADAVVFANAADAPRLWSRARGAVPALAEPWIAPLARTRGQVSIVAAGTPGLRAPALPIAGAGYAIALPDGAVLCGATSTDQDEEPGERLADHVHNLRQLAAITGSAPGATGLADVGHAEAEASALLAQGLLRGRVGWRATSADRLPWIGAVPAAPPPGAAAATLPDQPRRWPRVPGLFVASGFGSRGLTWAPLAGRLLASWITGAPYPLPADLVDALDPARFAARAVRASRRPGAQGVWPSA
jgi:tRNA 5-methylaminomethyl-2-thiouridine biosynthesis bifunctional protein